MTIPEIIIAGMCIRSVPTSNAHVRCAFLYDIIRSPGATISQGRWIRDWYRVISMNPKGIPIIDNSITESKLSYIKSKSLFQQFLVMSSSTTLIQFKKIS